MKISTRCLIINLVSFLWVSCSWANLSSWEQTKQDIAILLYTTQDVVSKHARVAAYNASFYAKVDNAWSRVYDADRDEAEEARNQAGSRASYGAATFLGDKANRDLGQAVEWAIGWRDKGWLSIKLSRCRSKEVEKAATSAAKLKAAEVIEVVFSNPRRNQVPLWYSVGKVAAQVAWERFLQEDQFSNLVFKALKNTPQRPHQPNWNKVKQYFEQGLTKFSEGIIEENLHIIPEVRELFLEGSRFDWNSENGNFLKDFPLLDQYHQEYASQFLSLLPPQIYQMVERYGKPQNEFTLIKKILKILTNPGARPERPTHGCILQ